MIMRKLNISRRILIPILVLVAIVPVVAADVIYYYSGVVNIYSTSSPLTISVGPNGVVSLPSGKGYYIDVTTTPANSFTADINITDSSYDYFYEAVTLTASSTLNLYITNVSYSPTSTTNPITNAWIIIDNSAGEYYGEFEVISSGSAVSSPSSVITLPSGTYYIGILIQPSTPLPSPSSSSIAKFTVYFGDNVASTIAVPLPPT